MHAPPAADAAYLEDLYARFLDDPLAVDPSLWLVFATWPDARATLRRARPPRPETAGDDGMARRSVATERLVTAWRTHGHLAATLDRKSTRLNSSHSCASRM